MVTVEKVEKIDLLKFLKLCKKFWSRSIRFLREHLAKNFFFCKVLSFIYSQSLKIFYFTSGCGGQESSEIFGSLILAEKQAGLYGNKMIRIGFTATELWPWLLWKRLGNLKRNLLKFLTLCYRFWPNCPTCFFLLFPWLKETVFSLWTRQRRRSWPGVKHFPNEKKEFLQQCLDWDEGNVEKQLF